MGRVKRVWDGRGALRICAWLVLTLPMKGEQGGGGCRQREEGEGDVQVDGAGHVG